ncbi:MAG: trimethylamine methyltransferase family protein [Deltaproteobacteria bacterium]|nr:trimethylamine methyltransferase family protein [Deltaproteobacteria bacterium]MBW2676649.1 trimethylamine methyltransferase family protein [Deltaproteobacteria bacterium]
MLNTNVTTQGSLTFRVLTEDQIFELTKAAMEILEKVGFNVLHEGARKLLKSAGAVVDGEMVKVPEFIVRQCLATAPKGWTIYDRNGKRALEVEGRKSYYGTSTASPNTKDALTGEYHETRVADLSLAAKVADALENIDWVMPMGSVQDVPAQAAELHEFVATVINTTKPIVFLSYSPQGMEIVFDMAEEIAGGRDKLRERPFLVAYPEPITPLVMPDYVVGRIFLAADRFLPQMMGPAVQLGATGPVTIPAAVAHGTAESMMCVVLAQLKNPGCPVGLGCNFAAFDMASGLMSAGGPEMSLALAAQAEVAQSFGLPTWGLAGATDAKVQDAQAGVEATFHIMAQGLAGLNLIHDVGYMDGSMACSVEQLVLGDEIIGMARRFMRGLDFSPRQIARDLMYQVGPGGEFLSQPHTVQHFKKELWRPSIFTRQPMESWKDEGEKDTLARVREKIRHISETHKPEPLPDALIETLERMKSEGELALTRE